MANYATLKAAIQQVVKTNGNNEITGALLQQSLLSMITSLGAGYQFAGVATPATNPGTPDYNVFYIAGPGTYPNFNNTTIQEQHMGVFTYNGTWSISSFPTSTSTIRIQQILGGIVQLFDGENPIYPRTKAEAVFFDNDTSKTLVQKVGEIIRELSLLDAEINGESDTDYSHFNITNAYIDNTGTVQPVSGNQMDCTGYIAVSNGNHFKYKGVTTAGTVSVIGYTNNQGSNPVVLVPGQTVNNEVEFTIPSGTTYIRAWSYNSNHSSGQQLVLIKYGTESSVLKKTDVVNNVSSGGTDVPLSAEMGKVLNQNIQETNQTVQGITTQKPAVDYSNYQIGHGYLDANGHYNSGTSGVYLQMDCTGFIPVVSGQKFTYSGITTASTKSVCGYSDQNENGMVVLVPGQTSNNTQVFTIPTGINFIRAWSYNQNYSTPTTLQIVKNAEDSDIVKGIKEYGFLKPNFKVLDASGKGDFTTIADAISGTPLNGTILVSPGQYDMRNVRFDKGQSFIGLDKEHCVFINPQIYHDSPFVFSGYYKNISWICSAISPASSYNQQNYTVHIDAVPHITGVPYRVHFEDCYFFNGNGDCFGCGASKDLEIIINHCKIELNGWMKNAACFALHNVANVTAGGEYDGAATVKIYNCILKSNRGALRFGSSNMQTPGVEWRSLFELVGNTFFSDLTNPNTGTIYGKDSIITGSVANEEAATITPISSFPDTFRLSPISTGNNVSWLNV